ncbi:MAG TPA: hypothetical protein VG294_00335 [Solirubrobacteraceae bacterium]|nr:hypothetical protein [Solirubrobacteraceae bacterium]
MRAKAGQRWTPLSGVRRVRPAALALAGLSLAGCSAAAGRPAVRTAAATARWTAAAPSPKVLDLGGPRRDGTIVVATAGRLALLAPRGALRPFARGRGGYVSPGGEEPYIALAAGQRVSSARCTFPSGTVYALRIRHGRGVTAIDPAGRARRFATLPTTTRANGIAFDATGRFGHRVLVTATAGSNTAVYAIDCRGTVTTVTQSAPRAEGGIAVAPATFGRFAGDLIAPDEISGRIYAIAPDGTSRLLADSGLPHGQDIGVESLGFVPAGFGARAGALVADRRTPGNRHPGDGVILRIGAASLTRAGVRAGDLLIASEGGAGTDAITCGASCQVRHVADGPPAAHVEGHIAFGGG